MGNGQSGAGKKVTTIRIAKIITPDRPSPNSQDCKTSIHSRSGSRNQPRHSTSKSKLTAAHGHPTAPFPRCLAGWSVSRYGVSQIDRLCHKEGGVVALSLDVSA